LTETQEEAALSKAYSTMPAARFYLKKVGSETAHKMGGHASESRKSKYLELLAKSCLGFRCLIEPGANITIVVGKVDSSPLLRFELIDFASASFEKDSAN
jgi:hypothetical protein